MSFKFSYKDYQYKVEIMFLFNLTETCLII